MSTESSKSLLAEGAAGKVALDATEQKSSVDITDLPPINDDGGGDGRLGCDWDEDFCPEEAHYFITVYCADPSCDKAHTKNYCKRHYLIRLGRTLRYVRQCPANDPSVPPEDRKIHVLRDHIADFGALSEA